MRAERKAAMLDTITVALTAGHLSVRRRLDPASAGCVTPVLVVVVAADR
jgi:hypothetical protein